MAQGVVFGRFHGDFGRGTCGAAMLDDTRMRCSVRGRVSTTSLRNCVGGLVSRLAPQRRRMFRLDHRRRLDCGRVTVQLSVDRGAMRHRVGRTLGFLHGGVCLFFVFLSLWWNVRRVVWWLPFCFGRFGFSLKSIVRLHMFVGE